MMVLSDGEAEDSAAHRATPQYRKYVRLIRRLERLAAEMQDSRFMRFEHPDVLTFQEQVGELQRDIQAEIGVTKKGRPRDKTSRVHLESLRRARWFSRRLGDAVAWSLLLFNRRVIYSLAGNDAVPVPSKENDGTRGAFLVARGLISPEWGLPVVHDITNVLRVGDITFMRPTKGDPTDARFQTFELKTSRESETPDPDGKAMTVRFNIQLVTNEAIPPSPARIGPPPKDDPATASPRPRREDRRLSTQMRRMDRAKFHRDAAFDDLAVFDGEASLHALLPDEEEPHWAELRRAMRQARRTGYGFFSLDGFVAYAVFYNADGLTEQDFKRHDLVEDIKRSVLHEHLSGVNNLTVSTVPDEDNDQFAPYVLPVFLWKVPQRAIRDIVRGRMVISASYNTARIEELLRAEGFRVDKAGKDPRDFVAVAKVEYPDGQRAEIESHAHWRDLFVAVHEFRGARSCVQRTVVARDVTLRIPFERFMEARSADDQDPDDVGEPPLAPTG